MSYDSPKHTNIPEMQLENIQCGNCGKIGHPYRSCSEPLTSYGIICYRKVEYDNMDFKYEIILIRRKDTIGYVEFLRGKYNVNNDRYIIKLINLMTGDEKNRILEVCDFDKLRNILGMNKKNTTYKTEYDEAKRKFDILVNENRLEDLISKTTNNWITPEWGLPKGRRQPREPDSHCAVREFYEETGLNSEDINLIVNVKPLEEVYMGINKIKYRHIYFFAEFIGNTEIRVDPDNKIQTSEISRVEWCGLDKCGKYIRPYHQDKINVIRKSFQILNNKDKYFKELEIL